ncbi:peroxidase-like protein 3 isoform X2 [Patella vulgata]|nr:peroxidase-like protein 3 isoform X2 [Patella vulgata]
MLMQWGQFLDHDITATAVQQPDMSKPGDDCCKHHYIQLNKLHPDSLERNKRCFPIPIVQWPVADPAFRSNCFNFVRSRPVNPKFTKWDPREQQNLLTAFIDGSNVYGSNEETLQRLRDSNGKMKTSSGDLLPPGKDDSCVLPKDKFCFDAGDERVNVFPGLTALHTVFVRLHNYIVTDFTKHNRRWDAERLFQEARKIVGAILQRITYTEFLPELLSDATMKEYKLEESNDYKYQSRINPSIASVFATAAFRYGHSLIPDFLVIDGKQVKSRLLFNNPQFIFTSLKSVVENILSNEAELRDRFMSSETTEHLFEQDKGGPFDLAAFNIQRGRDHGLPSYNAFRKLCNLSPIKHLTSPLSDVYGHVDDVDVFAGGMVEKNLAGSELGALFNCILGMQFRDLKFGDSFWYETKDSGRGFTAAQLKAIKKVSLSQILCQVLDLAEIQPNAFRIETDQNKKTKCNTLKGLDLSPWYEH